MSDTLHILHLEDDPADGELVAATLAADGLDFVCERVVTRDAFVAALERRYDLILSDFALPSFDGVSAQRLARERRPDLPFVFVSGTMGEEVAIDRLKEGATDYVLKHRLSRLGQAVRRAMAETATRRARQLAEEEVRRLNTELEGRVIERTARLSAVNRELEARERDVAEANGFLDSIIENLPLMLFVKEAKSLSFVRINRAGEDLIGTSRTAVLGHGDRDLFPPEIADIYVSADREVLARRQVVDIPEEVLPTRDHGPRILHTRKIPISDAAGEPAYLLGISEDITERRAAEEELRLARLEAERANRAKSEFLSRMSHDLRTPLNAVLGFAQLLETDAINGDQLDSVRQIIKGGRHLLDLINEVLDIARIESGHLSLSLEAVEAIDLVRQCADLLRPLAEKRGLTIDVAADSTDESYVRADRQRLRQIILNLLGNAVKYNRRGGSVTLTCERIGAARRRIAVRDTGAGIPPEKQRLLFQPFERLGAEQGPVEGTGLGLAVSKGLAEAMGGSLGFSSEVDRGSVFWIELPETEVPERVLQTEPAETVPSPAGEAHGLVLYIEDNQSNVRLLERLLRRRRQIDLISASRGEDGLVRARMDRPDLILLDLHLPDVSGEEVLHQLWSDPDTRSIPVAVLSADATPAQRQRVLASGAIAYLTKPLDITKVLRLLDERLQSTSKGDRRP